MNPFVDSTVLIDLLRQHPPAHRWFLTQPVLNITPIVWMEIIQGAQNRIARTNSVNLLARFQLVYPTQVDFEWAMQHLLTYRLSHNASLTDCLIASVCHRLQVALFTHNRKHIEPILVQALTITPY